MACPDWANTIIPKLELFQVGELGQEAHSDVGNPIFTQTETSEASHFGYFPTALIANSILIQIELDKIG